jgi:hypothetical protein
MNACDVHHHEALFGSIAVAASVKIALSSAYSYIVHCLLSMHGYCEGVVVGCFCVRAVCCVILSCVLGVVGRRAHKRGQTEGDPMQI